MKSPSSILVFLALCAHAAQNLDAEALQDAFRHGCFVVAQVGLGVVSLVACGIWLFRQARGLCTSCRAQPLFRRLALSALIVVAFTVGGTKTNGVNNIPPQQMALPRPVLQPLSVLPRPGTTVLLANPGQGSFAQHVAASWNVCGAWKDSFWLPFAGGWTFPWGTNHLAGVEVVSYGRLWPTPFDTNAVASAGAPFEIVPGLTSFAYELTPSNSHRFVWSDAAIGRDTDNLVTAELELFRCGDRSVTINGVATYLPRELPFPHDGFGQDAEWIAANFTNATEILSVGYPQWVDAQVGTGLTNGLYKLTVSVAEDPPETTFLFVGDLSVAVTNAGEYAFLMEKGPAYDLAVFPPSSNVTISAVDNVPTLRGQPILRSFGDAGDGQWVSDNGDFWNDYVSGMGHARFWWLPCLCGSPDVMHIDPTAGSVSFSANLVDCRGSAASFLWTGSDALTIASPNSQTTAVTAGLADWRLASLSVTAVFGPERSLTSYLCLSCGTNDVPQVACSLSVQSVHFINEGDRPERVYPVSVSLLCPVETNGVVDISHEGSDGALFWSDAAATQPLPSLSGIPLSSVDEESGDVSYMFYMTSPTVGGGSFTALFALPSGDTRGVAKPYRAIEPIRRLVCTEIDPEYSCVFNPARLVYGYPARLKVGANGNFSPGEVEWRVVSGPGTVTRDEDNFGEADWTATVAATATNGEVVVEARFNEDAIQPRFVLPIVQQRMIPIKAYVLCDTSGRVVVDNDAIAAKILYANEIYRQAGIEFYMPDAPVSLNMPQYRSIREYSIVTNGNGVACRGSRLSQDAVALMSAAPADGCVRTIWIDRITDSAAGAFSLRSNQVSFVSTIGSMRVLAHELGHLLGMSDIYVSRRVGDMPGAEHEIHRNCFGDHAHDWGVESGRGFYPASDTHGSIIKSLLMYGCDPAFGCDLPFGSVEGFGKSPANIFDKVFINVGTGGIVRP